MLQKPDNFTCYLQMIITALRIQFFLQIMKLRCNDWSVDWLSAAC
ncbi:hypothetical protein COMA2_140069 [Candidatus Nitrospira nitrificans]|uniref:Uncharacterized protein n=1 Tax=Candidatus Nitrospira nitrificans TaxID=1742973 RepID=A0A0S4LD19_9BACT|nr:hypothetical protein COMA2_140069 [Candidatus Nitrospira nitrificans]